MEIGVGESIPMGCVAWCSKSRRNVDTLEQEQQQSPFCSQSLRYTTTLINTTRTSILYSHGIRERPYFTLDPFLANGLY
ncbi:unnamed protein product [Zymoseptoria tritici ST99CH_3D7]|uniref:Uncharacterized protein n=1 Tax=Zymoseptoria tritici (strain ST99CH_3D7) TaxID=1276538 RepID=A0A1X7RGW2_ZYMT9|nr:unnamed protein product [Zymoseptoria tritici ST99CH_3D7]